jgi:hypothetical protein
MCADLGSNPVVCLDRRVAHIRREDVTLLVRMMSRNRSDEEDRELVQGLGSLLKLLPISCLHNPRAIGLQAISRFPLLAPGCLSVHPFVLE